MKKRENRIFPICLLLALAACVWKRRGAGIAGGVGKCVPKYIGKCQRQRERCG